MTDSADAQGAAYQFQHLTAFSPVTLQQIGTIYEVSFPLQERKPYSMLSDAMQRGHYSVSVVSLDTAAASQIVAFALLVRLRTSQAMYIEYLAVAQALRGQGIGSLLLRSMIAFLKDTTASAIVWEVDPPDQPGDEKARRIQFYEQFGARVIEQSKAYAMPNYRKGSGTLPLRMMWKPLHGDQPQPTKSELIAFITDIYETEYPGRNAVRDEIIANLDEP
jgi:ribosomal protein S18 acetylase RimI-like enzyme